MGVQDAIAEISTFLGQRLTRSKSDLDLHGRSESYFPLTPPDAVAYPETTQEVARILRACAKFSPIFPTSALASSLKTDGAGDYALVSSGAYVQEPR